MRVHCRMPHASLFYDFVRLINQATSDDLLDPITALLSHLKWLVIKRRITFFCVIAALTM